MRFHCFHSTLWLITMTYCTCNTNVYASTNSAEDNYLTNKLKDVNDKHEYLRIRGNLRRPFRIKRVAEDTTAAGATTSQISTAATTVPQVSNGAQAVATVVTTNPTVISTNVVAVAGGTNTGTNGGGNGGTWNNVNWGWDTGIGGWNNSGSGNWGTVDNSKPKTTGGLVCSTDLFKRLDRCCPTPTLISFSDIQRCAKRSYRKRRASQRDFFGNRRMHIVIYQGGAGRRGNVRGVGRMGRRGRNGMRNGTGAGGRSSWVTRGRTNINQVCLVDCVFRNLKWVSDDWMINANMMFATMAALVPPMWSTLINQARIDCAPLLFADTQQTMTATNGVVCLQFPTKMMRCVKRTLMLNCPTQVNGGPQCMDDVSMLRACDIQSI